MIKLELNKENNDFITKLALSKACKKEDLINAIIDNFRKIEK